MRGSFVVILTIGLASSLLGAGTIALFSDTETSAGNTFSAIGPIDLRIDWVEYRNGEFVEQVNLTSNPKAIFELKDVKPGDFGNASISLHVFGYGEECRVPIVMVLFVRKNDDVSSTEPELAAGDKQEDPNNKSDGELMQNTMLTIWLDDGDGKYEKNEIVLFRGYISCPLIILPLGCIQTCQTIYVGFKWKVNEDVGNIIQTDLCEFDLIFVAVKFDDPFINGFDPPFQNDLQDWLKSAIDRKN